jgi:surface antigen
MRHLLGRAAVVACALALISQPSFAVSVPKHHSHSAAAKPSAHKHAARLPVPKLRPAQDDDDVVLAKASRGRVPVPMARPSQAEDATVLALADVPVPAARPAQAGDDQDNLAADDSDTTATDQSAALAQTTPPPDLTGDAAPRIEVADHSYNCVAYVRERTGFAIQGDAHMWWTHAEDYYDRAAAPAPNAVMVFASTRAMKKGHVAIVTRLVSDRQIIVDHANWMRDGKLYLNMPVMDVSPDNDWSQVRVWNARDGQWGSRVYPISGFVSARPVA